MDWLIEIFERNGVGKESIDALIKDVKVEYPNHAIPKEQYNTKVQALKVAEEERNTANAQLEKVNEDLGKYEALAGENEELKKAIDATKNEFEEYKSGESTRTANIEKSHAVELLLRDSGANKDSIDLLVNSFDYDKITKLENGSFDGFDSQLASLKEKRPTLFAEVKPQDGGEPPAGDTGQSTKSATDMILGL